MVLKNIFKKEKPKVYLGVLAVVPRTGIKKNFDSLGVTGYRDIEGTLKKRLLEIFFLPPLNSLQAPKGNELAIDVLISDFQLGAAFFDETPIVIFWRPKITLVSKLYHLKTGRIKSIITVTEKMPWGEFFGRVLSYSALI